MTLEEYKKKAEECEDWTPGWEAIDECFEKIYPGQEPVHYGTNIAARAMVLTNFCFFCRRTFRWNPDELFVNYQRTFCLDLPNFSVFGPEHFF